MFYLSFCPGRDSSYCCSDVHPLAKSLYWLSCHCTKYMIARFPHQTIFFLFSACLPRSVLMKCLQLRAEQQYRRQFISCWKQFTSQKRLMTCLLTWALKVSLIKGNWLLSAAFLCLMVLRVAKNSYSTTNKMHLLSQIIYSCKTLYLFRTVFPSIIRSSNLRIQQRYMSKSCCYLLL